MRVPQFLVGFGPDGVLPAARRDRVRHQGHPARRLHPDRRHDPAGRGGREQARDPRCAASSPRSAASRSTTSCPPTATGSSTRKPWWQRVIVMFAGPFHNLVLAVVFFTVVLVGFGVPEATTTLATIPTACCPRGRSRPPPGPVLGPDHPAGDAAATWARPAAHCRRPARRRRPGCAPATRSSPSTARGSRPGPTDDGWAQVQDAIRASPTPRSCFTIERDGDAAGPHRHPDREHRLRRRQGSDRTIDRRLRRRQPGADLRPAVGHRRPRLPRDDDRAVGRQARADPAAGAAAVRRGVPRRSSATRTARSASSASAGSPARSSPSTKFTTHREGQLLLPAAGRREPRAVPVQPAADLPAGRRARRRGAVREGPLHGRPVCAAGPTRGRSTSPG